MSGNKIKAIFRPYVADKEELGRISPRLGSLGDGRSQQQMVDALLATVEGKSGTLLSHISMMITITGILWALTNKHVGYELLFGIHLVAYLSLALLCIRCQFQFDTDDYQSFKEGDPNNANSGKAAQYRVALMSELYFREKLFRFTLRGLYFLTFILSLTIVWSLFADDVSLLIGKVT